MKKYDDIVSLPRPVFAREEYEKFHRSVKKAIEYIHDIGNLNLIQPAAFSAHKNGTDQTGVVTSTWTKVTWSTEIFDINSEFASNKWTVPEARVIRISAGIMFSSLSDGITGTMALYKNGSIFKYGDRNINGAAGDMYLTSSWADKAAKDDYYEIYAWHNHGANRTIRGDTFTSYFMGY